MLYHFYIKEFEIHAKRNVFQDCRSFKILYILYLNGILIRDLMFVSSCSVLGDYHCFGLTCCHHLQGRS